MEKVILILGKSASGKSTLRNYMCENFRYNKVITYTTRPIRKGEVDGEDYYFVTVEEFKRLKKAKHFFENVKFGGNYYGIGYESLLKTENPLLVVTPHGLKMFRKKKYPHIAFYLEVPKLTRIFRQIFRGDELDKIKKRLRNDAVDFIGIYNKVNAIIRMKDNIGFRVDGTPECADMILTYISAIEEAME